MHPSFRLSAAARTPLIRFIGKRQWPTSPEAPRPHPSAPAELKQRFSDFIQKFQESTSKVVSSSFTSSSPPSKSAGSEQSDVRVFQQFWEAPTRLWMKELDEAEIEAITSGGASLR